MREVKIELTVEVLNRATEADIAEWLSFHLIPNRSMYELNPLAHLMRIADLVIPESFKYEIHKETKHAED